MQTNQLKSDVALFFLQQKLLQEVESNSTFCNNVGGKTRNIAFQFVLQQCFETSYTFNRSFTH